MNSKSQKLNQLAQSIIDQGVCADLAQTATQLVMGQGNPNAQVVFIGEAPGKKEDQLGVPFVGASGRLLDDLLAKAGLGRDQVYITNIVKYRPPNNRDPSKAEKQAFWPFLLQELEIIAPKIIVTLGRHSGGYFLPTLQISHDHGRLQKIHLEDKSYALLPLYHPAAALYDGSLRQTLIDDFMRLPKIIK